MDEYIEYLDKKLHFTAKLPVIFTSAVNQEGVHEVVGTARELFEFAGKKLGTGVLNRAMARFVEEHGTPVLGTKAAKIYYSVQTGIFPPEFTFFVNYPEAFNEGFLKYLERRLASELGSEELPVRIKLRAHGRAKHRTETTRRNDRRKT
jgi:GTP-binding protein